MDSHDSPNQPQVVGAGRRRGAKADTTAALEGSPAESVGGVPIEEADLPESELSEVYVPDDEQKAVGDGV